MDNKGFTLVELLAVIALIAVLLLIFTPNISNMINKFRNEDKVDILKKSAIRAAKEYVADSVAEGKITVADIKCNNKIYIEVNEKLINGKYLENKEKELNDLYKNGKIEVTYDSDNKKFTDYKFCIEVQGEGDPSNCTLKCKEN